MTTSVVPRVISGGVLKLERVQFICPACGQQVEAVAKDQTERRYYSCSGCWKDCHIGGSLKCTLPRMRADLLEKAVWRRLKAVLTDSEALKESLRNTLVELQQRRSELDDLEQGIALLEKVLDSKSGTVLLTELGIWTTSLPENVIAGYMLPSVSAWDEPGALEGFDFF
jgi:predicted RNA-binding Zn-ribbon protein involved in translation (DUF1610 family)